MQKKLTIGIVALLISLLATFTSYAGNISVHFIDVGQADAIFITCDGHNMLVDGGNKSDSDLIYSYLKKNKIDRLDYIVCTHDDEDHVGGLSGAVNYVKSNIGTIFAPYKTSEKERFNVFINQLKKYDKTISIPTVGSNYSLGSADFTILSLGSKEESSIVLRIKNGQHSFLLMGDATETAEKTLLNSEYEIKSSVLKVGHHGSSTSTNNKFLRKVNPEYAVICVGKYNQYGHPTQDVLDRLREQGSAVYRTDNNGDIVFTSDGKKITVQLEKEYDKLVNFIAGGTAVDAVTTRQVNSNNNVSNNTKASSEYVLNTNTKKFHYPSCNSVKKMKDKNKRVVTDTRENIINQGYVPCKNCNP